MGCTGRCYEKQVKVKDEKLGLPRKVSIVKINDKETDEEAEKRCEKAGAKWPTDLQQIAALKASIERAKLKQEHCKWDGEGDKADSECICLFNDWGDFLPKDKWLSTWVEGIHESNGCKFQFWTSVFTKVRVRHGECHNNFILHSAAYIPEWDLEADQEHFALLSDESRALLKEGLG